jgi:hypothetical protein
VVLPYNETAIYEGRLRLGNVVTKFEYSLSLLTVVPSTPSKIKMVVQRVVVAAAGVFTLGGQDAQLRRNLKLTATFGSFALTGEDAALRPLLLAGEPGSYVFSGQPALLTRPSGDPYWNDTKLLLHMDGTLGSKTFTDSGPLALTVTAFGNTIISTAQSQFGGASGQFDGTNDNLTIADNDAWNIGSSDFTFEVWVRPVDTVDRGLISQRGTSSLNYGWEVTLASDTLFFRYSTNGTTFSSLSRSLSITLNTWAHIAVCRSGNSLYFFKDGTLLGTNTLTATIFNSTASLLVAARGGLSTGFNGYMDELRFTRAARYTTSFSVQTAAFPEYAQTV